MFASMLKLTRADCKALNIKDAYSVHKVVYSLFPKKDEDTRDFLYADKGGDWNCRQILILSERKPETPRFGEIISKEIPEPFLQWDYYGFEIIVNPTQRNGPSKTTTPIRGRENLRMWFIQKAASWGFEVEPEESLQVGSIGVVSFDRNKDDRTVTHTYNSATFIGKIKVTDRQAFVKSFKLGIGRAKGFGFGLLQIVPIQK
ncbi:MAG: type I-E CRISPR-associated protein Cas6/Cse3/CasE [Candidatus Desantisbacteria bacterium]